ncbi:glucose-dependent insulinotropic receptor isoform X2 [Cephus cinctus]|uniref:Glucose-dependent insulinotropic receptor isoform X2 n=1 Tax=Cephus cinctus TaxID=211228 RepID=A0AAJ7RPZ5_CEPCN|nr:glucose-dependent insulinotropic receptor isoform X2 [Cephus cinctus]
MMEYVSDDQYVEVTTDSLILVSTTLDPRNNLTNVYGVKTQLALYDVLIPVLGCLIIVTNLAVTLSSGLLLKKGVQPKATYLFLGNVAMADLLTGVAVLFGMIVSSTITSIYSVGLIAIDRFLYIVHGLNYSRWVYPTRARLLILFTWILGLIIGFLPLTGWSGSTNNGRWCWFIKLAPPGLIILITVIGLLPILLVLILYGIILYHAINKVTQLQRADARQAATAATSGTAEKNKITEIRITRGGLGAEVQDAKSTNQKRRSKPSKVKAVKVVLLTSGSFVVTWMPYFIACCVYVTCDERTQNCGTLKVAIASPLAILGFLNSLLNPIIYAWWHKGFRGFLRSILCRPEPSNNQSSTSNTRSGSSSSRSKRTLTASVSSQESRRESSAIS